MLPGLQPFPPPPRGALRTRHDACLVRPERSLSVQEIMSGALSGPDLQRHERLLAKQKMTSEQAAAARRRWRTAARIAAMSTTQAGKSKLSFPLPTAFGSPRASSLGSSPRAGASPVSVLTNLAGGSALRSRAS